MIFFSFEHLKAQLLVERVGGGTRSELGVGVNIWQPRCEGWTGPGTGLRGWDFLATPPKGGGATRENQPP